MTAAPALDRRADFVSAVAVELADLAPDDRAELIEELDDHVAALLEDRPDADLVAELGTPRAYAAELRTAAGLQAGTTTLPLRVRAAAWRSRVDARVPDGARPFLRALRQVWWVFRGYTLFAAACHAMGASWANDGIGVLIPAPAGLWGFGVLGSVLAAAASVWLGGWRPAGAGPRLGLAALNVVAAIAALVLAGGARYESYDAYSVDTQYVQNCPIELSNLYAYDAAGRPLTQVRLFDQNGNPFDLSVFGCNGGRYAPDGFVNAYPWPSASNGAATEPTGPPASLAPLPGATVSGPVTAAPTSSSTPTPSGS